MAFDFSEDSSLWDGIETVSYEVFTESGYAGYTVVGLFRASSTEVASVEGGDVPFSTQRFHIEAADLLDDAIVPKRDDRLTDGDGNIWYVVSVDNQTQNTRYALNLSRSRN